MTGQGEGGSKSILIVGLDGVPWELLNAVTSRGRMPHLASLIPQARRGVLRSTLPPNTGPAWTTFATGKNPGKHGIFSLFRYGDGFVPRPVQSTDIQGETFYEILSRAGLRSVLINLPVSYPPREFKGVIVGDLLSPGPYIYPPDLEPILDGYRVFYDHRLEGMDLVEDILDVERRRTNVARQLFDHQPWDLFFVMFSGTDWLSHFCYPEMLRERTNLGVRAASLFTEVDRLLGEWMAKLPPHAHAILLSDHGFQECSHRLDLNSWLEARSLATKRRRRAGDPQAEGHTLVRRSGREVITPPGLLRLARRFPRARRAFLRAMRAVGRDVKFDSPFEVDPERSRAFALRGSPYGIYINPRSPVNPEERERLVRGIVLGLRELRNPKYPGPAFEVVGEREEIYGSGNAVFMAPDVVCIPAPGLFLDVSLTHGPGIVPKAASWHSQEGFILMTGPTFSPGELERADMCDLAPTILELLHLAVPPDMDGRPLRGNGRGFIKGDAENSPGG